MQPTPEEVQAEIKKLKEMKPKVRHHTGFGDDNWAAIEADIDVLTNDLDQDTIYDLYGESDYELESCLYARDWLDGSGEPPSGPDGWGSLVKE